MSFAINEKLLEGEVRVVPVGDKKKGVMGYLMVAAAALVLGGGGVHLYNQHQSTGEIKTSHPAVLENIKQEINGGIKNNTAKPQDTNSVNEIRSLDNASNSLDNGPIKNPILGNFISDANLKSQIEKMGNFEIPSDMKPNQISRHVAQVMFEKAGYAGYTSSLISEREGFKKHLYNDVGWFALGNGFNLGVQNKQHIKNVLGTVTKDQDYINELANLSGKHVDQIVPANFKNLTITPQKSIQVAMIMSQTFEKSVINSFSKEVGSAKGKQLFDSLKDNEKAALVNVAYQMGTIPSSLNKSVVKYAQDSNKTPQKAIEAISGLSITYMLNGTRVSDTRSETLAKTMFSNTDVFKKVIQNTIKPKDIAEFAPIFKGNVKVGASGQTEITDPIGVEKEKAEKEGRVLKMTIMPDIKPIVKSVPKNSAVFYGI